MNTFDLLQTTWGTMQMIQVIVEVGVVLTVVNVGLAVVQLFSKWDDQHLNKKEKRELKKKEMQA